MLQRLDLGRGAWLAHVAGFVVEHHAVMARLLEQLPLRQEALTLFGRRVTTPRLTSWHGDAGCRYRYSGRTFDPNPWTTELTSMREALVQASDYPFNCVLANYYRDGSDSMGKHRDDERELGPTPDDIAVGSVSLGGRRRFCLRERDGGQTHRFDLGGGDLLLMGGTTQRHFEHWVPKTTRLVEPRLNLTFRVLVTNV